MLFVGTKGNCPGPIQAIILSELGKRTWRDNTTLSPSLVEHYCEKRFKSDQAASEAI